MTIAFIVLVVLGAALLIYLLVADMMEIAVFAMAALIVLSASSAWMQLAPVVMIFGALGLVVVGVLAVLIYKSVERSGASSKQAGRAE